MEVVIFNHPARHVNESEARLKLIEQLSEIVHYPPLTPRQSDGTCSAELINFELQLQRPHLRAPRHGRGRGRADRARASAEPEGKPFWQLTFPTIEFGTKFLQHMMSHRTSFDVRVEFVQSTTRIGGQRRIKVPNPALINQLKKTPFRSALAERQSELELNQSWERMGVASIALGRLSDRQSIQDASFQVEYQREFCEWELAHLTIDQTSNQIVISSRELNANVWQATIIRFKSIKRIEGDERATLLFLDHPPVFFQIPVNAADLQPSVLAPADLTRFKDRVHGFDGYHSRVLPFASRLMRIEFAHEVSYRKFCKTRTGIKLPRVNHIQRTISFTKYYSMQNLEQLTKLQQELPIAVSFQLDLLVYNGILNPEDVFKLGLRVGNLEPDLAEKVLIRLAAVLSSDDEDLVDLIEEIPGSIVRERSHRLINIREEFTRALEAVESRTTRFIGQPRAHHHDFFACRSVTITPTGMHLEGPHYERSNSILRRYSSNNNFIRVSIRDEDGSKYSHDREVDCAHFLKTRNRPIFVNGLKLAGRKFEFLGYSQSALAAHQTWFVCPFDFQGEIITAQEIRDRLGDFSKVIKIPARYMARISQAFTTTQQGVRLTPSQIEMIPDIQRYFSLFTDGVGTISPLLADKVEAALLGALPEHKRQRSSNSSCYQIRLGGFKGMISLDCTLEGEVLQLRESMKKFEAKESLTLDIASSFRKPLASFLNRPLIQILEGGGVPSRVFLNLQQAAVNMIESSRESLNRSAKLIKKIGLGGSSRFEKMLRRISRFVNTDSVDEIQSGFLEDCLDLMVIHSLKDLKYRARIPLEDSFNLVGVADEDQILEPHQIFACVQEKGKSRRYIKGLVTICRSPCIHPGDVQIVEAVGQPPAGSKRLQHLVNCVVFSTQGSRSIPSCLGGGDLDGDLYQLITDPNLRPRHTRPAAAYPPAQMKKLDVPCTIEDGVDFFLDYIMSDLVGVISNRHLHLSDQSPHGSLDPNCLKLADLHSKAVDYPKTGVPVSNDDLPRVEGVKPDFMCSDYINTEKKCFKDRFYESNRALGELFRSIPTDKIEFFESGPSGTRLPDQLPRNRKTGKLDEAGRITYGIESVCRRYGLNDYPDPLWYHEFQEMLESFSDEFLKICRLNVLTRAKAARRGSVKEHLSEPEGFIGMILSATSDKRLKRDTVVRLEEQTMELFGTLRAEIRGHMINIFNEEDEGYDDNDALSQAGDSESNPRIELDKTLISRALTGWHVALEANETIFGAHSFGLICFDILGAALGF